jgi:hypothetical protein
MKKASLVLLALAAVLAALLPANAVLAATVHAKVEMISS